MSRIYKIDLSIIFWVMLIKLHLLFAGFVTLYLFDTKRTEQAVMLFFDIHASMLWPILICVVLLMDIGYDIYVWRKEKKQEENKK